jgi:hypothetical protein
MAFSAGGTSQFTMANGVIAPVTDSDVDLGTSSLYFKDSFIDTVTTTGNVTIGGNLILGSATVTEAQAEILDGATVTTTELNLIDGGATVGTTAIADGDGLLINDAGTMRVSTVQTLAAYLDDEITAMPNLVTTAATTVGVLGSGSIAAGFGNIDNGASNITSGGLVRLDVDTDADDVSADSATGRLSLGAGQDLNLYHGGTNSYIVNETGSLLIHTDASDADIVITGNDGGSDVTALTIDMSASGQFHFQDGTAALPILSNAGDTDTGLLFSAANTLAFSAGGTAQFTMADGAISPVTTNDIDLGTASLQYKNVYVDGTTFTDAIGFGTVVMTLPTADGDADQILTTDGSGTLSFVDNSGGTSWVAVKTGNYTASAGEGVFANTSGSAWTLTLPAGTLGDEISFLDYAGTFDTNALTIAANGSEKIHGSTDNLTVSVERAANTLVFTDGTQGWLLKSK